MLFANFCQNNNQKMQRFTKNIVIDLQAITDDLISKEHFALGEGNHAGWWKQNLKL